MPTPDTSTLTKLGDLLDAERIALLEGDLQVLKDLLSSKEALMDAVKDMPDPDRAAMQVLEGRLQRNQLLLDGALEGIRAVAQRMGRMREVKGALETYGADGKRHDIPLFPRRSVERRA